MKGRSTWRAVRVIQTSIERDLRQRHTLWAHGACIGAVVVGVMWLVAAMQLRIGSDSLAWRYLVTLGIGYLSYLLVLRLWAGALVDGRSPLDPGFDIPSWDGAGSRGTQEAFRSGGGGDFGGGGASGDFGVPGDGVGDAAAEVLGEAAKGAVELAAGTDEGAIIAIPVVAIFLIGVAILFGTGSLLLLYFGSDALLAVAVELAFGYAAGRTALRVSREGWIGAAVKLTWKPLLGAVGCAVLLGATIDHFVPAARSLPHAVRLIAASR
jgi:hypothetical protein